MNFLAASIARQVLAGERRRGSTNRRLSALVRHAIRRGQIPKNAGARLRTAVRRLIAKWAEWPEGETWE